MDNLTLTDLRKSVRNFTNKPVEAEKLREMENFFGQCRKIDNSIEVEIVMTEKENLPKDVEKIGGYNGFFIDAPHYIMIFSENAPYFVENAGYMGEDIILKLTGMDIDSCWLTIKETEVMKPEGKRLAALIAIGYGERTKKTAVLKNMFGRNIDMGLEAPVPGTDNEIRMDILDMVFKNDYGERMDLDFLKNSGLADGFYAAQRAPSALNQQPWRFILDNDMVVLVINENGHANEYGTKISAGAAMLNFAAVIGERLFVVRWEMGGVDRKYNIPEGCYIAAHCKV